jgi:hypothetical protein
VRARGDRCRQVGPTEQRKREKERRERGLAPTGGVCLSGAPGAQARARARRAGPAGLAWAEIAFLFISGISNAFLFYFP